MKHIEIAKAAVSPDEIRHLADLQLAEGTLPDDPRLLLAGELVCDAALEVAADRRSEPSITKMVTLGDVELNLRETGAYKALSKAFEDGTVSSEEIDALLLRGSVSSVIANALESGLSEEDIAKSSIRIAPIGYGKFIDGDKKPNGLKRLFQRWTDR